MKQNSKSEPTYKLWLALMVGNSRLHWALFIGKNLHSTWDSSHTVKPGIENMTIYPQPEDAESYVSQNTGHLPFIFASVVPAQTETWQNYPNAQLITLDQIPIAGMYPTLGIDRALALFGAGTTWGFPILIIDAGTALTFTGADANQRLVGGAILPGLSLQLTSLGQQTGQLPLLEISEISELPPRFALDTKEAIKSGIIYTLLAGIKDFIDNWLSLFPKSKIAITGGNSDLLKTYLKKHFPEIGEKLISERNLIFWGMREVFMVNKE
ncbi:pantothenate kinase [Anabaena sphaerica FACHB-251]|uniref:Type III pantothenate kinase n=1 Tax=Anabaena sphaerica FACHB-251 TaxID=2692883 RepID=A0A926WHP2_9NOST|nr:pantothenate kinase [Anabaena sphaerica FACHB-251]